MNKLVESLRYFALPLAGETRKPPNADLLRAAADEIERLRKSLDDHLNSEAAETRRADREREKRREAESKVEQVLAEVERLREWQRQMVEKAADKSLAGYRELAQKLADKDEEIERLRQSRLPDEVVDIKVVIELRAEIERLRSQLAAMECEAIVQEMTQ